MNLQSHPTWFIRDSSKLKTYCECPRQYFYQYVLGWKKDIPAHDLHFGESWHKAREHQLIHGYDDISGAYSAFINHYRLKFPQESDGIYTPKDPTAVGMALLKFAQERHGDLTNNELLYTEIAGTVPVDQNRKLHYRMDSILRTREGKIFSWDHKSATEKSINYPGWETDFYLSLQNFTYTHCLYCMYPIEDVLGIEFCGTGFGFLKRTQEYRITLKRVPAFRPPDQMNVGLYTVLAIMDKIDQDMDRLFSCKESDSVLMAFHLNPSSCTKYRGCPYHDFCLSMSNPLQRCQVPPLGFIQEFWNPAEVETTNKKDLEWGE